MRKFIKKMPVMRTIAMTMAAIFTLSTMAFSMDIHGNTGVRVVDGDKSEYIVTFEETVGEFFEEVDIKLSENDVLNVNLDDKIYDNMRIEIKRGYTVTVVIDGKEKREIKTNDTPIGKILNKLDTKNEKYILQDGMSSAQITEPGMIINVSSVKVVTNVVEESIPFETKTVENANLAKGTSQVQTEGKNGLKKIITKITYIGGELVSSEKTEQIVAQPITKIIENGTKAEVLNKGVSGYDFSHLEKKQHYLMSATAYSSADCGKAPSHSAYGITASGMRAHVGLVAVDRRLIPLGTKLYVEGYGYAIAADTGGAIKGNKIDLYYNTRSECFAFGRRNVNVWVLG